ncbi:IS66 family transposase [Anaerobaca lacustris]|uniref:IS66 family transposase n=1 Tax=Anaerobaca lacustris TaxID=3044600 RepID=A0AAW6U5Q1_9BACT|nr:IS66 family transposase [Sedimentisphaerales bacterium M17dextr]
MGNLRKIRRASRRGHPGAVRPQADGGVEPIELDRSELEAILDRAKTTPLSDEEYNTLHAAMETLVFLTAELEKKRVSVQRLKQLLFGATTETTQKVMEKILHQTGKEDPSDSGTAEGQEPKTRPKANGHGRNGADAYVGAEKVCIPHESLKPGDPCPSCKKGTVYQSVEPGRLVRIRGQAPLGATVYELQKLRCHLCGEIFTARPPAGVGTAKYDAASASMIALLKYGSGLPFNRLERLEGGLGIPLPASTQWEIVDRSAERIEPVFAEMIRQAAQGQLFHNDDSTMKILALCGLDAGALTSEESSAPDRKGIFTSAIISVLDDLRIALFFTGHRHAGENLAAVLKQRACERDRPIQMCDALSRNMPKELQTLVANCLAHGRRHFVEVAAHFPDECLYVLQILKVVYANDAIAKDQQMSPEQRLAFHQASSQPKMEELKDWMTAQIEERKVEPNSSLGEAITYMRKHWDRLTLFLRHPGAPLDNNICEQALKKAILHRKNAYFYKTEHGARVGDLFMSLIHTCELNAVNPFDYLTELNQHADELAASPADWMPWTYRDTLAKHATSGPS